MNFPYFIVRTVIILASLGIASSILAAAQTASPTADEVTESTQPSVEKTVLDVAKSVDVAPVNSDEKISRRLSEILDATRWFDSPQVKVDRGVVFLSGIADSEKHRQWAEATSMNTGDVVAVVNRITVAEQPLWNFAPAVTSLKQLGRETTAILPLMVVAIVITVLSYYLAKLTALIARHLAGRRVDNTLIREVIANVCAVVVFIIGFYIALRISGLTRLAVTLLGGTGLVGLALGFAFRDIAENYLSSILISMNHPFRVGDLIEVGDAKGFVRKVTTRGTVLNTLEGNQIQIPNSTVYKSKILNYTATPLLRLTFSVGIGFDDSIAEAQSLIMKSLNEHPAVVHDPQPLVLVDSLGAATVNLQGLYWINQTTHSQLKVGSSVIRKIKEVLTEAKITMPDEARELVFPKGVPVRMIGPSESPSPGQIVDAGRSRSIDAKASPSLPKPRAEEATATEGEGDLSSEQDEVMRATRDDSIVADEPNLIS